MTQEEKDLLLLDLCARLPYGVKILQGGVVMETLQSICKIGDNDYTVNPNTNDMYNGFYIEQVKSYLRSLTSMTDEEKIEFSELDKNLENSFAWFPGISNMTKWLNQHHFDYNGLINRGLAIEVTDEFNPYKK